ncbi:hypothetical protein ACHAO8_005527 [Botrytis cinerea]
MRASLRSGTSSKIAVVHKSRSELSNASRVTINATYEAGDLLSSKTTSSTVVTGALIRLSTNLESIVSPSSNSAPSISSKSPHPSPLYECCLQELPTTILISPDDSLETIILSIGKVEYISQYQTNEKNDVPKGKERSQSEELAEGDHQEQRHIDVRGPELDGELVLTKRDSDSKEVEFCVNDGGEYNTCVRIGWGVEEG